MRAVSYSGKFKGFKYSPSERIRSQSHSGQTSNPPHPDTSSLVLDVSKRKTDELSSPSVSVSTPSPESPHANLSSPGVSLLSSSLASRNSAVGLTKVSITAPADLTASPKSLRKMRAPLLFFKMMLRTMRSRSVREIQVVLRKRNIREKTRKNQSSKRAVY